MSSWTREDKIHIHKRACNILYLVYKHTNDDVFWRFSEDFWPLSEDFRRFSKIVPKERRTFPNIFRTFSEDYRDFRRQPKISEGGPMMFRSYSNTSKYFWRDYVITAMVIIVVAMATPICVWWRYDFLVKGKILVFHRCLCNKTWYITKENFWRKNIESAIGKLRTQQL